jgi:hypothetical protein
VQAPASRASPSTAGARARRRRASARDAAAGRRVQQRGARGAPCVVRCCWQCCAQTAARRCVLALRLRQVPRAGRAAAAVGHAQPGARGLRQTRVRRQTPRKHRWRLPWRADVAAAVAGGWERLGMVTVARREAGSGRDAVAAPRFRAAGRAGGCQASCLARGCASAATAPARLPRSPPPPPMCAPAALR